MKRASPSPTPPWAVRVCRVALVLLVAVATQTTALPTASAQSTAAQTPHPAVVRITVPEGAATAYGSGTLIDVRDQYGLVVTNWHVVRDATGQIDVAFPDGFHSAARALKVDADWDLAALVIWRPRAQPVPLAAAAPRPGDLLTIAGYGQGSYRQATGRCTQYLAPRIDLPSEMVELDVQARQGDSGGPIFNERGELAGVLFGAGRGITTGSYAGRVGGFLASVAPELGRGDNVEIAAVPRGNTATTANQTAQLGRPSSQPIESDNSFDGRRSHPLDQNTGGSAHIAAFVANRSPAASATKSDRAVVLAEVPAQPPSRHAVLTWRDVAGESFFEQAKTVLAIVGLLVLVYHLFRRAA